MEKKKKIALLIDYDNFNQEKYFPILLEELNEIGDVLIKYAYYSNLKDQTIQNKFIKYGIEPKSQIAYSSGKNAVDIKMTIEAMRIVSKDYIDAICLASNDSDFTPLVFALKSYNKYVIGAGDNIAKETYIQGFDTFISVEKMIEVKSPKKTYMTERQKALASLVERVNSIIDKNHDEEGFSDFSYVVLTLKKEMKDFNPKNYGAKNKFALAFFQKFLTTYFELKKEGTIYAIRERRTKKAKT